MQVPEWADVIVVGGGPAGATVAAEVRRYGASVFLAEKRTGDSPSRAGVIQPRVLELLDLRGQMGRFREAAANWRPDFEVPWYMYAGQLGLRYFELDSDFPYALVMPQTTTEHLLRDWATELGADIRRGLKYVGHRETEDGVEVDFIDEDAEVSTVRGNYLIGADGARSEVRAATGIPFEGRELSFTAISVDADFDFRWPIGMVMRKNEAGWVLCYPFGHHTTRFIIVAEALKSTPMNEPVTIEEVNQHLSAIFEEDLGITSVQRMGRFNDMHKNVPQLHKGRVFLVGESTRVHYPASGIGMNYCIQDAFNLGWKLGAVATGAAAAQLLETYDAERFPVLTAIMDDVDVQTNLQFDFSETGRKLQRLFEAELIHLPEVNRHLAGKLTGFATHYHRPDDEHPAIGLRVNRATLVDGRTYAQIAVDTHFVYLEAEPAGERSLPERVGYGLAPALPALEFARGAAAILVRPDGYIGHAWSSLPSDAEIADVYQRLLGAGVATAGAR